MKIKPGKPAQPTNTLLSEVGVYKIRSKHSAIDQILNESSNKVENTEQTNLSYVKTPYVKTPYVRTPYVRTSLVDEEQLSSFEFNKS